MAPLSQDNQPPRRQLLLESLESRVLLSGTPVPTAMLDVPGDQMINEAFQFAVQFDNTGALATDVGYAPYIDLHVPDEIDVGNATYLGSPVNMVLAGVFDASGDLVHPVSMAPVDHPLLGTPVAGGTPGESLYVIELPFGSFVPDQPVVGITIDATLDKADGAVVGVPLTIKAQAGFALGCDPLDNPGSDPPVSGTSTSAAITPTVINLIKQSDAPESETATGRNFPTTFTLAVDIADGETVTNLDLRDLLPNSFAYLPGSLSVVVAPGVTASGQSISDLPVTPGPQNAPDNDLLVEFASVTGTTSSQDILVTYQVYVPEFDADGASVLDPNSGDDVIAINDASVTADYETGPVGDDDGATDFALEQSSIAIQKSVSIVTDVGGTGATPGDTLEYTLQFQISDFFTFGDLVISDLFSDGQLFDWGFGAAFTITDRAGIEIGSFSVRGAGDPDLGETLVVDETLVDRTDDAAENPVTDGTTTLTFDVSQALIENLALDGILQGGATLASDVPNSPAAAATGTITFRTIIQEEFADTFVSGDRSVDHGDILTNNVVITGTIRENENEDGDATPFEVLGSESDDSGASVAIVPGNLIKSIYAVNGNTVLPAPLQIAPGDTVTYSLEYSLPSSDFEDVSLTDFLPLPIFDVLDPDADEVAGPGWTFNAEAFAAQRAIAPLAGIVELGPNDTFFDSRPGFSDFFSTSNVSTDGSANSLRFDFGTYDDPTSSAHTIQLLFTVTVSDDPFADGLFLTNIAQSSESTTFLGSSLVDSIVQIELTEPDLNVTKGVVATDASGIFSGPTGPAGVTFNAPGDVTAFTGTIHSDGLAAQPVDANLSGLDAGDRVRFAIVVENLGSSRTGAFDIRLQDVLPAGFSFVAGSLQIVDGTGATIGWVDVNAGNPGLFGDGIELLDPGSTVAQPDGTDGGAIDAYDATSGRNIAVLVYDAQLQSTVQPGEQLANTVTLSNYAGQEGGDDHTTTDLVDSSFVEIAEPTLTKSLIGTGIISATNAINEAVIGEYVTYEVVVTLTEGITTAAEIFDRLDAGLQFVSLNSVTASSGDVTSSIDAFASTASFNPSITNGGRDLTFDLGTLTNVNTTNAVAETLTLNYTVRVDNVGTNQTELNTQLNNEARFEWDLGGVLQQTSNASAADVEVIEPDLQINKSVLPGIVDAGDTVTYTITIDHAAASDTAAFDVTFSDALPGGLSVDFVTGVTITHSASGDIKPLFQLSGGTLETIPGLSFDLLLGESVTLTVTGTLQTSVQPGELISNTAQFAWTSLDDGNPSDGDDASERDGSGGTDDYAGSDSVSFTLAEPTLAKNLVSTGIINATNAINEAVIGEYVTYEVIVTLTEGTTTAAEIFDRLDAGLQFVSLNSVTASSGDVTSSIDAFASTASFNPSITNGGRDLTFDLGTLTNVNTTNAVAETLTLNYTVRVDNVGTNQTELNTQLNNEARFEWDLGGVLQQTSNASAADVEVIEPDLQINKSVLPGIVDAGDTVTYTITIDHAAASDTAAFDVTFSDALPGGLNVDFVTGVTITHSASGDIKPLFQLSGGTLETIPGLSFDLLLGESVTLTVTGTLQTSVQPGELISNTAQFAWTSLDDGDPSDGDDASERNGSGGTDDYAGSDSVSFTLAEPTLAKNLVSTGIINATNAINEAVIGEYVTYEVIVTLTEGTTTAADIFDRLDAGLQFVSLNSVTASSGDVTSSIDAFASTASFNPSITNGGRDLTFDLGTLTNANTNNAGAETLTLNYTVRVDNVGTNQTELNTQLNNEARFEWDLGGVLQQTSNANAADVEVIEPDLQIDKSVLPGVGDAGDTVTYTITIDHAAASDTAAFDVTFSDALPGGLNVDFVTGVTITHSASGDIKPLFQLSGGTLETIPGLSFDLLLGESVTLTVTGTLQTSVQPGELISNTAQFAWTSLDDGNPSDGDDASERDGSGGTDDYAGSDSVSFTLAEPTLAKNLVSTGIINATNAINEAVIGEYVTYEVIVTLTEGTTTAAEIFDRLDAGLQFVSLNSVTASSGDVTSSIDAFASTASFNPSITNGGLDLTFDLGTLTNANTNNAGAETLTLNYTVRVDNVGTNQTELNTQLNNEARFEWDLGGVLQQTSNANAANVEVIEPDLQINKSVLPGIVDAGDTVTYTITIDHTAASDTAAFDVTFSDALPGGLNVDFVTGVTITHSASGDIKPLFQLSGGTLETIPGLSFDLLLGESVTLTVTGTLQTSVQPGELISNTAQFAWTSLDDGDPSDGDDASERNGSGGTDDYAGSDSVSFTLAQPTLAKNLVSTGIINATNAINEAVIGEYVTYEVIVTLTEGTTTAAEIFDRLDAGLQFVSLNSVTASSGDVTSSIDAFASTASFNPTITNGGRDLTFDLGTLTNVNTTNAVAETLTLNYTVRVDNVGANQTELNTQLNNEARFEWDLGGVLQQTSNASAADVEVIEPDLDISKSINPAVADANDPVTYTISIDHNATSDTDAFDVTFSDTLPAEIVANYPGDFTIIHSALGDISALFELSGNTLQTISGQSFDLALGDTVTITVNGTLSASVQPGTTLANTANVAWTSLDNDAPLDGDDAQERNGTGGANDYSESSTVNLSIPAPGITKTLVGTSVVSANNSITQAVIGETAQYTVTFTVPEGVMVTAQLIDTLDAGLEFVSLDGVVARSGGLLTGEVQTDIGTGDFSDTASFLPTIAGNVLTFDLGNIQNTNNDNMAAETVTLTYTVRVTNAAGNQTESNTLLDNMAYVAWTAGGVPTQTANADAVDLEVIEPTLVIDKTADDSTPHLGQTVLYTLTISHDPASDTDAFDLNLADLLPAGMTLDLSSLSIVGATVVADNSTGNAIDLDLDQLLLGNTITVTYEATMSSDPAQLGASLVNNAAVTWTSLAGSPTGERTGAGGTDDYQDNDSQLVTPVGADLALVKDDGLTSVVAGQTFTYTITVTNNGTDAATGITVTDMLAVDRLSFVSTDDPAHVSFDAGTGQLVWTPAAPLDHLAPNNTISLQITVQALEPLAAGIDSVTNVASVTHDDVEPTPADNSDSDTDTLVAAPDYTITKSDGQTNVLPGDVITYSITVQNVGNQDGTGVVVHDTYDAGALTIVFADSGGVVDAGAGTIDWSLGDVAAGDTVTLSVVAQVRAPAAAGIDDFTNTVVVTDDGANGVDPTPGNNTDVDTDTLVAAPDLYVTKDDGQAIVIAGDTVTYTINYGNAGTQGATGVVLTETLPTGATFNAAGSTAGWTETAPGSGIYEFSIGNLASGGSGSVTYSVIVDDPLAAGIDQLVNNVGIADDGTNGADEDPTDNSDTDTDTITAAPDLYVTKDDGQAVVIAGDTVTYTINYGNAGSQDATGVVLTETLPTGATFNAAGSTAGWTETAPGSGVYEFSIGNLASGGSGSLTYSVIVDDPLAAGIDQLVNNVSIADDGTNGADEDPTDNSDTDTDTITAAPDLYVTKDDGQAVVIAGDTVSYTINYGNAGTQDATGVVLTETLPTGATFNAAGSTAGWTETAPGSGIYEFSIGNLASGGSGSVTFSMIVDNPLAAGIDQLVNNVSIADDGTNGADEDPTDNNDTDTDTITAAPDLYVTKEDGQAVVIAGDTVTYTINYGNAGSQDATGVVLTETLPTGATFNAAGSTAGWTETAPGSGVFEFSIGNLASGGSGSVTYSVIVDDPLAAGIDQLVNNVSIADDGTNGADEDPTNNTDSDTDTITAAPDLYVTKDDGQAIVIAGDTVTYTINYGNAGTQGATGVVLTETLPTGAAFNAAGSTAGWTETAPGSGVFEFSIGNLASGGSGSVTYSVIVDDPLAAGIDQLVNNVGIADDGTNGADEDPTDNSDTDTDTITAAPDLYVTKDDGQAVVIAGDTVTYTINYGNAGSQDATGVVLTETLPTGATFNAAGSTAGWTETAPGSGVYEFSIGNLASGGSGSLTYSVIVDDPLAAGIDQLVNNVSIADDGTNGADEDPTDNSDTDTDTITAAPDLYVTKDDGQAIVIAGDTVTYTINYGNAGSQDATGVVLTETLPTGATFNAAGSTAGWTETAPGSGVYEFSIGNLASGGSGSVTYSVIVDDPLAAGIDQLVNNVAIADDGVNGADEDPTDNSDTDTDTITAAPDLYVTKDDGQAIVIAGDTVTYTINYGNAGSQDATGVVLTETLPTGATFNAAGSTAGWTETAPGSGVYEFSIGNLTSGGSGSVTYSVIVDDPLAAGIDQLVNNVSIADDGTNGGDEDPTNNTDSDTDTITAAPDLYVTKDDGQAVVIAGDTVTYTINYGNAGSQDATGVVLTETLPTGAAFNAAGSTAGWTETAPGSGVYEFSIGNLASGGSGSVTYSVIVDNPLAASIDQLVNNVSIADDGTNGADEDPTDNSDTDTDTITAAPDLYVTKDDGQAVVIAGDTVTYTINYGNAGTQDATGVVLTETLPTGATFNAAGSTAGWTETAPGSGIYEFSIGNLASGGSGSVTFSVIVDNPLAAGIDQLVNNVSIADDSTNGADEDPTDNNDTDTDTITAAPDLYVTKEDGQAVVIAGDTVTYTINYGNAGSQDATGVVLTETLPTGATFNAAGSTAGWTETAPGSGVFEFSIGNLTSGGSGSVTYSVIVDDPLAAGIDQLVNNVSIADDGTNGADEDPTNNTDSDTDTVTAAPDLYVTKDDGQAVVIAGDTVTYTINYGNAGSQDATGVVLTETLPTGAAFNAAGSTAGWTETAPGSGVYEFSIGNLASGGSGSVTYSVIVDDPLAASIDQLVNNVSIADDGTNGADEDPTDNSDTDTDTITAAPDLYVTKDDGQAVVIAGDTVTYTINYGNAGTQDATGVVLTETLPSGATFNAAGSTAGWTETAPGSGIYAFSIGNLASGGSGSLTFSVIVDDPLAAGIDQLVNNVSIADDGTNGADEDPTDNSDTDTDTITAAPDLYVTKDDGQAIVIAGDTVTYTINYGNAGSQGATSVVLTETLPTGATFNAAGSTAGWTETAPGSGIYEFSIGNLASGDSGSVTFSVIVDDPLAAGIDQLVNNVSIADDGTNGADEDPTDNSDTDTDTITAAPDLYVTKDDGQAVVIAGDTVTYTINYGNAGSQDATGVVLTETLPTGATFNAAGSTAGWTETAPGSGIYELSIGNLASGSSGSVTYSVIVDDPLAAGIDQLVNNVGIADDGTNGADEDPTNNTDSDTDTITAAPDLYVTKDDGQAVVIAGDTVTYTINYGNAGSQDATGVVLTETLPTGATFNAAGSTAGWTETAPGSGVFEFSIGNLASGNSGSVTFAVIVDDPLAAGIDQLVNNVGIADDGTNGADEDPTDNTDSDTDMITAAPDLYITKDDGQAVVIAGDTVTYTINYGNAGTQGATGVVLTETLPTGATFNAAGSTAGWTETAPGSGVYEFSIGNLASGGSGSVTYSVIVDDPLAAGIDQLVNNVSIADDGTNGADEDPTDNSDTDTDTITAAPDLYVTKEDGLNIVIAGDTVTYTVNYGNAGTQGATGVVLTETLPTGATFNAAGSTAGWTETAPGSGIYEFSIGNLASGGSGSVTFSVIVDDPLAAGIDQLVNNVSIADDGTNGADEDPTDNSDTDTDTVTAAPDLYVTKDDGQSVVIAGDTVTYTINYGNAGSQDATGVVLTETLPTGATFNAAGSTAGWTETAPGSGVFELSIGNLASGGSGSVTFSVVVDDPLAAAIVQLVNNVSIADDGTNGADEDPTDNSDTDTDTITAAPDLYVTKDDGQSVVVAGDTVTYTVNYGNAGMQDATGVVLTETLPTGATFNAAGSTAGWTETAPGSGIFELSIGSVASGASGSVTFSVIVDDPLAAGIDQLVNNISIADDGTNGADEDPTDNSDTDTDTITAAPNLYVTKDDGQAVVITGDTVTYAINYGNAGTQDATGVVLTETLPIGATFNAAGSAAGWTETAPGSGIFELSIGNLASGNSGSVTFSVIVDDPLAAGIDQLVNSVSIADDGTNGTDEDATDNTDSDTDTITAAPDLYVTKDDGQAVVIAGDTVTYTINYGNAGTQGATGVVLTETLPTGATFNAAGSTAGWGETAPGSGIYEFSIGNLASGSSGSVNFSVIVDDPLAAGIDQLFNSVSIADDGTNGADDDPTDNSDTDTDTITAAPDLYVTKDDGQAVVIAGDTVTYTINYGNAGTQGATGVVLTETLPTGATFNAAGSTAGWTETAPGSGVFEFSIGNLASGGSGSVTYSVIVDDPLAAGIDQLVNNVSIADDGTNGADEDPTDNSDTDTDTITAAPDLYVTKDDGQAVVIAGDTVTYTINYGNAGTQDATGVVLTETLPTGATFNAAGSTAGWTETAPGSGVYEFSIGNLASGGSGSVTFSVIVDDPLAAGIDQLVNNVAIADDGVNGADEDPTDNSDTDTDTITAAPDLYVTKDDGQAIVIAGDTVTYNINYGNAGSQDATGVVLTETLPTGATFNAAGSTAGWSETAPGSGVYEFSIGNLASGGSGSVTFSVIVDGPLAAGIDQLVNNVAIADDGVNGADEDPTDNSDTDTDTITAAPDLYVTKDDGQAIVIAGDTVTYTINYGNAGTQGATGVVLTETLPTGATFNAAGSTAGWAETAPGSGVFEFSIGNLASGGSGSVTFSVIVDDPLAAGIDQLVNNVGIADDGTNGADEDPTDNSDTDTDTITAAPDLYVTKDDGQAVVIAGDTVTYTINYGNAGSQDATGVVLTETLPTGATFNAAGSTAGWTETAPGSGVYEFSIGNLASGGSGSVTYSVIVDDPLAAGIDQLVNNVSIADDGTNGADEDPTDNSDTDTDTITAAPDLYVTKDDGQAVVIAGDTVTYTVNYGNAGSQDATGVVLTETLPTGATFNAAGSTAGWTETAPGSGVYEFSIGNLASGGSGSVTYSVIVDDPLAAGIDQLVNNVAIADDGVNGADEDPTDNSDTDTDTITAAPDLYVTKDDGQAIVIAGDTATYTVNYGNAGTQDATGVVLTETLPTGATFNAAGSTAGWSETAPGSGVYEFSIGNLASGGSGSVTFSVIVDDPLAAGIDQLVNNVSIADDGTNGADDDPTDNSDTDTDAITAAPDLYVTKDDGQAVVIAGDTVTYTINYGNAGTQGATGVVLTETLPTGATFNAAGSAAGWTETAPGSGIFELSIGNLASGNSGSVTFSVIVDDPLAAGIDQLVNSVSIADDGTNGTEEDATDNTDSDTDTITAAPDLYVAKDDGQTVVIAGDTVTYTINYGNAGTQGATGVVLTETLPTGATFNAAGSTAGWSETAPGSGIYEFSIGNLASGGSGSVNFSVIVDDPLAAGIDQLFNNVSIADDGTNGADEDPTDNSDTDTDTITAAPDLYVTKDDGQSVVIAGDTVTYTINYGNAGTQGATGIVLTETLPTGATFNAAGSTAGWAETAPGSGVFEFSIGNLASGGSGSVTFSVIVDDPLAAGIDQLVNNVSIADDGTNGTDLDGDNNEDHDSTIVSAAPDYSVVKDDFVTSLLPGETTTYSIVVTNSGNQDGTGVVVRDDFSPALLLGVTADQGGVVDVVNGTIIWNLGDLAAGESVILSVSGTVISPLPNGVVELVNSVRVTDDGLNGTDLTPENNSDLDVDALDAAPDLWVLKSDGDAEAFVGSNVVYTLIYGNRGRQIATGVLIRETLAAGTEFNASASSPGWVAVGGGQYELALGQLEVGETGIAEFAVRLVDVAAAGSPLQNTAMISDDGQNGTDLIPEDNQHTDETPVAGASITGSVFVDNNDDGIENFGDGPLAGVVIRLTGTDDAGNPVTMTTTTDQNGRYEFAPLAAGTYTVRQDQPFGFADGQDSTGSPGGSVTGNDEITIRLASGEEAIANNFAETSGAPGLVISKRWFLASTASGVYPDAPPSGATAASAAPPLAPPAGIRMSVSRSMVTRLPAPMVRTPRSAIRSEPAASTTEPRRAAPSPRVVHRFERFVASPVARQVSPVDQPANASRSPSSSSPTNLRRTAAVTGHRATNALDFRTRTTRFRSVITPTASEATQDEPLQVKDSSRPTIRAARAARVGEVETLAGKQDGSFQVWRWLESRVSRWTRWVSSQSEEA